MTVWALSDPHLSFSVPDKNMEFFGEVWTGYTDKIKSHWEAVIGPDDLVLVPGDISWAMKFEDALIDLEWIHALPGTKLICKGNHDYWWGSVSKMTKTMPPSIHIIHNNVFTWKDISIGGARLWDTAEFNFNDYIVFRENVRAKNKGPKDPKEVEKIFARELGRLELSLQQLDQKAKTRIAITHYPPVSADLQDSRASAILEKYNVDICVFGHLHTVRKEAEMFGEKNGIRYIFASCDHLDYKPVKVLP